MITGSTFEQQNHNKPGISMQMIHKMVSII